ncbi:hypothetical protein ILUMI_26316 [Ignelater luminosus]|uniref:Uncharacterized protein n=1 Tax=Ignelater luminosus TaxID=2038154 RepID=A0A8K0C5Y9_IGNLU|nr:hypothetical protein ILUMI_26316 [Ignelater luminosus]
MEFKRNSVIALYLAGKSQSAIVRELEHIKVNRKFVYRTINRYNETGSVVKRYGGGPKKTATSPEMVRKVKKRLERNPRRSGNQMAKELNISQSSIRRILQNELQVKAYKKQKAHDLTPNQKKVRFERAKELLRLAASGDFPNIVFSDEKNFPIEQFVNTQNDRVYLTERTYENLKHRLVTRSNYPSQIMVWAAVTATGRSPLVFIEPGVKVYIYEATLEIENSNLITIMIMCLRLQAHAGCHRAWRLEEADKDIDHVTGFTLNDAKRIWRSLRLADHSTLKPSSKQTSVELVFKYKGQLYIKKIHQMQKHVIATQKNDQG